MSRKQAPVAARRVAVMGAGSWGTTYAKVLADAGNDVTLWARRPEVAKEIEETKRNSRYLAGINLPRNLHATSSLAEAFDGADEVYFCVPSQALRENLTAAARVMEQGTIAVSLMKGVEKQSGLRMSQVLLEELEIDPELVAVVSGPNLALEIAREEPTASVVSSESMDTASRVAISSTNNYFRCFVNNDVPGTEFGGVLKNLIAVAVGIVDGVGYGDNTKASIITRGLAEITQFAVAYGAQPETLGGLAGLGDLIATCGSPLSRNNTAGRLLGQGLSYNDVVKQMNQTAEGLASVAPILALAKARNVEMPIVEQVNLVLAGRMNPRDIAPHLTTDADEPQGERTLDDNQNRGRGSLWRPFKRTRN